MALLLLAQGAWLRVSKRKPVGTVELGAKPRLRSKMTPPLGHQGHILHFELRATWHKLAPLLDMLIMMAPGDSTQISSSNVMNLAHPSWLLTNVSLKSQLYYLFRIISFAAFSSTMTWSSNFSTPLRRSAGWYHDDDTICIAIYYREITAKTFVKVRKGPTKLNPGAERSIV